MKTIKMLSLCLLLVLSFFACEDPMEDLQPIQEEPVVTTDGGGGGAGGGGCPFNNCE